MNLTPRAYVLLTAMPPTRGHLALIRFASNFILSATPAISSGVGTVEVHLQTQPGEPFPEERYAALVEATRKMRNVSVHRMHKALPQEPDKETEAKFWGMWTGFLQDWGIKPGDYIIASEGYGAKLAEGLEGVTFIPYDTDREIVHTRATDIRINTDDHFADIIPEFQKYLRKRVTFFGAESTGKTTLSKAVAADLGVLNDGKGAVWTPEWARPYLEQTGPEVTVGGMYNILHGQWAIQWSASDLAAEQSAPYIIQDTDLWSTVGFWELPSSAAMWAGTSEDLTPPIDLYESARGLQSDLYIVCPSDGIPFTPDPLRYGGDKRESSDQYWIDLLEREGLRYVVLEETTEYGRTMEAVDIIYDLFQESAGLLSFDRMQQRTDQSGVGSVVPFPDA